jgi:hypothetical protein
MVKTFCPFAGDRARRAERPVLTQGRALVAFGRVSAWALYAERFARSSAHSARCS